MSFCIAAENAKPCSILAQMIAEAKEIRENQSCRQAAINQANMQLQSKNMFNHEESVN
jgi:serine/threonine kinase 3